MVEYIILFIILICSSAFLSKKEYRSIRHIFLLCSCFVVACMVGFRPLDYSDTLNYVETFRVKIKPIYSYSLDDNIETYSERGFIILSSFIKTITSSGRFYILTISFITFSVLAYDLKMYSMYPLIGLVVYICRFMLGRDLQQIRASLAICIVIAATSLLASKQIWKYVCVIIFASLFHVSVLLVIPIIWLCKYKYSTRQIFIILLLSIVCVYLISPYVQEFAAQISIIFNKGAAYVGADERYSSGLGVFNPMIYYQSFLLIIYSYLLERKPIQYGQTIKCAYLYSTVILIILSPLLVLSARLSTIYATYEIAIIPAIIYMTEKRFRAYVFIAFSIILFGVLLININNNI